MAGDQVEPEPDLYAIATMLHALANTYGPCHSVSIAVRPPPEPVTLLDLIPTTPTPRRAA